MFAGHSQWSNHQQGGGERIPGGSNTGTRLGPWPAHDAVAAARRPSWVDASLLSNDTSVTLTMEFFSTCLPREAHKQHAACCKLLQGRLRESKASGFGYLRNQISCFRSHISDSIFQIYISEFGIQIPVFRFQMLDFIFEVWEHHSSHNRTFGPLRLQPLFSILDSQTKRT